MNEEYMPSDMQYKDELRKQRDNWSYVINQIKASDGYKNNDVNIKNALERAEQEYNRIIESLQD